ncbi:transposase [Colwellia sp. BRX8-4]|uniref:transposase n=1 Tax=Colwellia sp. BRX8-4 TaxID=2759836 RepID=UPI0015F370E5|nr:transposase [Colwellia sp. BRX8-4]MBA6364496.1 transposase [Colwellia sp. BRX8-8]MBA6373011.1 transposase [Colwellia sp. BRX8-4]
MATPRKQQISLIDTPYYHCVARCVRRAFLCGEDALSGQSFDHRREWVEEKLHFLIEVFAIDVCAYAVMSNHYHVVLFIDEEKAKQWSMSDVLERWHRLHKGTLLTQQYCRGEALAKPLLDIVKETSEVYRKRLMKISWFMGYINEGIARAANQEDNCTGRFWEGRFKSQALLDEAALVACMAYVDLNPIRANIAKTPESSTHTSVKLRCEQAKKSQQPNALLSFVGHPRKKMVKGLTFELTDYLQLIELTGRCIREDKYGFIENSQPNILSRLNISAKNWLIITTQFSKQFHGAVGHEDALSDYCEHQKLKRRQNLSHCNKLFA